MKKLLGTVVYSIDKQELCDFFKSIEKQIDKNFDFLIINDGSNYDLSCINLVRTKVIDVNNSSFARNREMILEYAKDNNYDLLIFSDCDDVLSENRIESYNRSCQKEFYYNDLQTFSSKHKGNKTIKLPERIMKVNEILENNFVGLTHSAISLNFLINFKIPENIIAIDWYIFTILLLNNYKGYKVDNALTYYRQSDNNIVGVSEYLTYERLLTGINVKKQHYKSVAEYCVCNRLKEYALFNGLYKDIVDLEEKIKNEIFREEYINKINKNFNSIYKGWWSEILTIQKWELI